MKTLGRIVKSLGILIAVAVILLYIPITVPKLLGYESYGITSGSMAPAINTGTLVFARATEPETLKTGDVIVYSTYGEGDFVTHRVQENDIDYRMLITKGDANATEDLSPISYDSVIGKVEFHIPLLGYIAPWLSTGSGKTAAGTFLACSLLLSAAGTAMTESKKNKAEMPDKDTADEDGKYQVRNLVLLGATFMLTGLIIVAGINLYPGLKEHIEGIKSYKQINNYVKISAEAPEADGESKKDKEKDEEVYFPWDVEWPDVDFEGLKELNKDVIGWIYLEGPEVSYPILQGSDNDFYLHHDIEGNTSVYGSVFLDCRNTPDFAGRHSIIYGHHMADGTMFAAISNYKKQDFYDEHPIGLLITPEQNYVIEFFAGYVTEGFSYAWNVDFPSDEIYEAWLKDALNQSLFETELEINAASAKNIVTLVTCSYEFDDARFALLGILHPEPKDK